VNNPRSEKKKRSPAWEGLLKQDNGVLGHELYAVDSKLANSMLSIIEQEGLALIFSVNINWQTDRLMVTAQHTLVGFLKKFMHPL